MARDLGIQVSEVRQQLDAAKVTLTDNLGIKEKNLNKALDPLLHILAFDIPVIAEPEPMRAPTRPQEENQHYKYGHPLCRPRAAA